MGSKCSSAKEDDDAEGSMHRPDVYVSNGVALLVILFLIYLIFDVVYAAIIAKDIAKLIDLIPVLVFWPFIIYPFRFICGSIFMICLPSSTYYKNSKYLSAHKTRVSVNKLPHITIQIPVYNEAEDVIFTTTDECLEVMNYYREQGGECNLFMNEDGLLSDAISEDRVSTRIDYYNKHKIGYVARPAGNRQGLFKKASNMNYCINYALRINQPTEALHGNDIRFGDIILLLDADTRLPRKCLHDIVGEFAVNPKLGFAQCYTVPFKTSTNFWEDSIAHFTRHVYDLGILANVAFGDAPPLVGHNAFIRRDALLRCAIVHNEYPMYWAEDKVSEDFDFMLRCAAHNFIGRYLFYTHTSEIDTFKEGVSLTMYDEYIRLKKYSYGAAEICFNKIKDWPREGIFNQLLIGFMKSSHPMSSKIATTAYLFTYFAMAVSLPLMISTTVLYRYQDIPLLHPFDIFVTAFSVYCMVGFTSAIIFYKKFTSESMIRIVYDEIKMTVVMTLFWSGIVYYVTFSICSYLFNSNVSWGSTRKSINFNQCTWGSEFKFIWKENYTMFVFNIVVLLGFMAWHYLQDVAYEYQADGPLFMFVATHVLTPFLLNPVIMSCGSGRCKKWCIKEHDEESTDQKAHYQKKKKKHRRKSSYDLSHTFKRQAPRDNEDDEDSTIMELVVSEDNTLSNMYL
eukprot:825908_1